MIFLSFQNQFLPLNSDLFKFKQNTFLVNLPSLTEHVSKMNLKNTNLYLTIIIFLLFAPSFSYGNQQENPLVKAILLIEQKNYEEAEPILKKLVDEKTEHLMASYYYGVCRTENNHFGPQELNYLLKGSTGEAPLESDYYLGVQYHAQNRWEDAIKHYNSYGSKVNEQEKRNVQLAEKIQQCYRKENLFENKNEPITTDVMPVAIPRETNSETYTPVISKDIMEIPDSTDTTASSVPVDSTTPVAVRHTEKISSAAEPINFVVNEEITYIDTSQFKTKTGKQFYNSWNEKQKVLDKSQTEIDALREKYGAVKSYEEKQSIGQQILEAETNIYTLQKENKQLFMQAKQAEAEYWQNASIEEKNNFLAEDHETISFSYEKESIVEEMDSNKLIAPAVLFVGAESTQQTDEKAEDELIYKIQLGAYSRGLPNYIKKLFDKLSYIRKIENYTDEKGIVVYTTGNLNNYEDALKMQNQVRLEGVEDAFVVPYFNGKRITLIEAKKIEAGR